MSAAFWAKVARFNAEWAKRLEQQPWLVRRAWVMDDEVEESEAA